MQRLRTSSWTQRGLYLFALVLVLSPLSDLLTTVWPLLPGETTWRYGFLGLAAGYLHTPMLGLLVALLTAHLGEHRAVLRALGTASWIVAVAMMVAMLVFVMDVVAVVDMRPPEARRAIVVGGLLQEAKYATAALVLILLGTGARREGRD